MPLTTRGGSNRFNMRGTRRRFERRSPQGALNLRGVRGQRSIIGGPHVSRVNEQIRMVVKRFLVCGRTYPSDLSPNL